MAYGIAPRTHAAPLRINKRNTRGTRDIVTSYARHHIMAHSCDVGDLVACNAAARARAAASRNWPSHSIWLMAGGRTASRCAPHTARTTKRSIPGHAPRASRSSVFMPARCAYYCASSAAQRTTHTTPHAHHQRNAVVNKIDAASWRRRRERGGIGMASRTHCCTTALCLSIISTGSEISKPRVNNSRIKQRRRNGRRAYQQRAGAA